MKIMKDNQGKRTKKPPNTTDIQNEILNEPRRNLKTVLRVILKNYYSIF